MGHLGAISKAWVQLHAMGAPLCALFFVFFCGLTGRYEDIFVQCWWPSSSDGYLGMASPLLAYRSDRGCKFRSYRMLTGSRFIHLLANWVRI